VRALNRAGDSIPGAPITLITLTPDTLGVVPQQHTVFGIAAGPGRIVARTGDLVTQPLRVVVRTP
jgi:hypothetical protein